MKLPLFGTKNPPTDLLSSTLLNEDTFYSAFIKDLKRCKSEVIIESPYITTRRLSELLPILEKLKARKVRVVINTRDPRSITEEYRREDTQEAASRLQHLGIHVVLTPNHHRKLAVMDRSILYEGSLNILSQSNSAEVMRRVDSVRLSWEILWFTKADELV
jgi:phosphatidylserine/phosphatidylglycerophosphate/cardiolipin synthase-like enzyme